jgi:acetyl esterase/lipase
VRTTIVSLVCTILALGGASASARAAGVTTTLDVPYVAGAGDLRRLDIYAPASAHDAPVLVFFHGGGRETGSRKDITKLAEQLAGVGILVVSPSYRLRTPATMDVNFAVQAGDAGTAIAWVQQHVAAYGGDPNGIVLSGVSAGAGLAALVATDTHYIAAAGGDPRHVSAAFIMSGVLDNRPIPSDYPNPSMWQHDFGLTEDDRYDVSPLKFVAHDTMAILVSTGANDNARFVSTGQTFVARMRAVGAPISTYTVPGADHASEWLQMTTAGSAFQLELIAYVRAHAGKNR